MKPTRLTAVFTDLSVKFEGALGNSCRPQVRGSHTGNKYFIQIVVE